MYSTRNANIKKIAKLKYKCNVDHICHKFQNVLWNNFWWFPCHSSADVIIACLWLLSSLYGWFHNQFKTGTSWTITLQIDEKLEYLLFMGTSFFVCGGEPQLGLNYNYVTNHEVLEQLTRLLKNQFKGLHMVVSVFFKYMLNL